MVWYLIVSIPDLCTITYFQGRGHSDSKMVRDTPPPEDASTPNLTFIPQIIWEIYSGHDYSRNEVL